MKLKDSKTLDVRADVLLSYADIAARWGDIHPKTAYKRLKQLGIPPHRITKRTVLFRLSDILKLEEDCQ